MLVVICTVFVLGLSRHNIIIRGPYFVTNKMDTVTRKNFKKGNKENARPSGHTKTQFISKSAPAKTVVAPSAPLHWKNNKTGSMGKEDAPKVNTEQKGVKATTAGDSKRRNTLSQAFLAKQAVKQRKLVAETTKPPSTIPNKPVPGTYKGKVVQSRISSFRKPGALGGGSECKVATSTSVPKADSQMLGKLPMARSKSVADLPVHGRFKVPQSCQPSRSKSVSNGPPPVSKCTVPPTRTAPFTVVCPSSRSAMRSKGKELPQSTKPKTTLAMDKNVKKPPVSSSLSQYRANTETAEERRAKLAQWLASKGKSLKRPPISVSARSKQVFKPEPMVYSESTAASQQETKVAEPEPLIPGENTHGVPEEETSCTLPLIMNTTLDLLDNSDTDFLPVDPEVKMNDVVVNLCDALKAMETPSACVDEEPEEKYPQEEKMEESEPNKAFEDSPENTSDCLEYESKGGAGASELKMRKVYVKDIKSDDSLTERTPEAEAASIVKYSVTTTPYLQSVKRTIDDEAFGSGSRRKSAIKDLKFLTPVRRSCRIQRKSCRLPGMLADHDTCVSSLAELVNLDDDANAYIYRRNPAILEDLPDHPKDLERI
ncbi:hypothetical protein UPYG_G00121400 [Umbra pygmaea]|uniref:Cytoskeleton-associated protein 2 C-terminal domain-containing protein n=1 Tax=Umbra pygmaea TaxID=75934 RepID=A0ABD0XKE8_UMBPY